MRYRPLILLVLLVAISSWFLWARWPITRNVAASETAATAQDSPPSRPASTPMRAATPTREMTPTPPVPMPTLAATRQVESDWSTYISPYWGITFRYPPGWQVTGAEANTFFPMGATDAQRIAETIGSPIFLNSTEENEGSILVILAKETLSPEGSLAEWVPLHSQYHGMMGMGSLPLQLSTIPADALPEGIAQGILSIGERAVNPPRTVWLERGGLVYSFSSTYNREEDMALIFAIISTLEFDPDVEAMVHVSDGLQGDENTLREKIAQVQASITPTCDFDCEYIYRMEELARAKTLPASQRPMVQPLRFEAPEESWPTYTQPLLGISFRYAPFMEIVDPFAENGPKNDLVNDLDEESLFDEALVIVSEGQEGYTGAEVMRIELMPYLISDDVPLTNWEAIHDQLHRTRNPLHQFEYRQVVPIEWGRLAGEADDIVHLQDQAYFYRVETFWLRKDHVVFRITADYPTLAPLALPIISTIQFDTERLEELRAMGIFKGDERTMVAELQEAWANPLPPVDPQATPTPIPTRTPHPTATPTPVVRDPVTPSALESPLINGLQRYQGTSNYTGYPPFELWFDPDIWQWSVSEQGNNYLVHQNIERCEIFPDGWATHVIPLAPVTLAGVEWSISYFPTTAGDFIAYTRGWNDIAYTVLLSLPNPIPQIYNADNKSQCERDAEIVIATHKILAPEESSLMHTPTPTPTRQG